MKSFKEFINEQRIRSYTVLISMKGNRQNIEIEVQNGKVKRIDTGSQSLANYKPLIHQDILQKGGGTAENIKLIEKALRDTVAEIEAGAAYDKKTDLPFITKFRMTLGSKLGWTELVSFGKLVEIEIH